MIHLWTELLADTAIVALFVSIWMNGGSLAGFGSPAMRQAGFGLLFGLGAIAAMQMPFELRPGVFVDLRTTPIALAAYFGGPISGLIGAAVASAYRLYLGGMGTTAGTLALAIACAAGLIGHMLSHGTRTSAVNVALLSLIVAIGGPLSMFALPKSVWMTAIPTAGLPLATLVFFATLIAGLAMANEIKRRSVMQANRVYRAVIEALPDCLNAKDIEGRFLVANPATAKLMRADGSDALIGKTDFDFYPKDMARHFRVDEENVLTSGQSAMIEQAVTRRDGSPGWLSTLKAPLRSADGEMIGIITHNRDITEKKQLESNLEQSERRLSEALAQMADGLVKFDKDGRIEFSNGQYLAMFPRTADVRVPGQSLRDILRTGFARGEHEPMEPEGRDVWIDHIVQSLGRTGVRQIALDDGRWIEARTKPTSDGALVVYSDVTAAKRTEKQMREMNAKLETLASTDGLTGLLNRRSFDAILSAEVARTGRGSAPLSLLMIDVDRFKAFNDTYGHPAGDDALRRIAECLRVSLRRPSDKAARYGGEELGAILPDTATEGAIGLAEAFRANVYDLNIPHIGSEKGRITVSIGIASVDCDADLTGNGVVRLADEALYAAKAGGRNLVRAVLKPVGNSEQAVRAAS